MLTISKPISASQAQAYHREEFQSARENDYTEGDAICGMWHGRLAEAWGLRGEVSEEHFARLPLSTLGCPSFLPIEFTVSSATTLRPAR